MAYIEPCEVEEILGSCCTCQYTPQGGDGGNGGDGGSGIDPECGVPMGGVCESSDDCAGNFCCRDFSTSHAWLPKIMVECDSEDDCYRCWDCDGHSTDGCDPCGDDGWDCEECRSNHRWCPGGCTHSFVCDPFSCGYEDFPPNGWHDPTDEGCPVYECGGHWHGSGPCGCFAYEWMTVSSSAVCHDWLEEGDVPDYFECDCPGDGCRLEDTTPGACCMYSWNGSENRYEYDGCEIRPMNNCRTPSHHRNVYWGINTTCEEFEDCCGFSEAECDVDADCQSDYCCSDFGNCVPCASCDCQCIDNVEEWECCEETNGDGLWHSGETCESYDCEEDCPDDEPECSPSNPCPSCWSCQSGICVPECEESSDCPNNKCCGAGCCYVCEDDCEGDDGCPGSQCCINGSCTYDCPPEDECNESLPCPGDQICEDGTCVDPPEPPICESDAGCPPAQCCEGGECVDCDPIPPDDDECNTSSDCPEGLCCTNIPSSGENVCMECVVVETCGENSPDGPFCYCEWTEGGVVPCEEGDIPDEYGLCYLVYCCCTTAGCGYLVCGE